MNASYLQEIVNACFFLLNISHRVLPPCGCVISSMNLDRSRYFECVFVLLVYILTERIVYEPAISCIHIRHSVDSITSSWKLDKMNFVYFCMRPLCVKDTTEIDLQN